MHASLPPEFPLEKNSPLEKLAALLWGAHRHMREGLRHALAHHSISALSAAAATIAVDTIFGIDQIAEEHLFEYLAAHEHEAPAFVLVGEFEAGDTLKFGQGEPQFRVLLDPIDGTRLVMFAKSSGWILSGIFPEQGAATRLSQTLFALQTEIPLPKYLYADTLWAAPGKGAHRLAENLLTRETDLSAWRVDRATDLRHGFVSFVNFFQHGKTAMAAVEENFLREALAEHAADPALVFEDQHLSTAGQLYALVAGQERMVVDIRPPMNRLLRAKGQAPMLCSHPYDFATWLIAAEAGAVILAPNGEPFEAPAIANAEIGWIGFANQQLAERYQEILLHTLRRHELI
ncbi:MAG: hypothetical protein AAB354_04390 [candidate division KSB1 bacterium]